MLKSKLILLAVVALYFSSCSNSPEEKAQTSVKRFLKENLKNPDSYEPNSFSKLDTLKTPDTTEAKRFSLYEITHIYSVINSEKENVKMSVTFLLDKELKVNKVTSQSLNGEFGSLTGNAYWKYNNYIGNKADAGAEITLYSLDSIRGNLKFETTADLNGNYKIEKILPGNYLLIVRSKNATDCPDIHFSNLTQYREQIKLVFGFDINQYKSQIDEINVLDSLYYQVSEEFPSNGTLAEMSASIAKSDMVDKERTEKIKSLFELFPVEFKTQIKLYTAYSNI